MTHKNRILYITQYHKSPAANISGQDCASSKFVVLYYLYLVGDGAGFNCPPAAKLKRWQINKAHTAMKQKFFILTAFLSLMSCSNSNRNSAGRVNQDSLVIVKTTDSLVFLIEVPPYDSLGKFPQTAIEIKKANGKPTFLQFTAVGQTNIYVGEHEVVDTAWGSNSRLTFGPSETALLDISNYETGTYYVTYSSFKVGGTYKIHLIE